MMTYEWDYQVPSGELVRIRSRIDQMSRFSDKDGDYKMVLMSVPKSLDANLEFDGKAIFNKKSTVGYSSYLDILFFYVQKGGQEDRFMENLPEGLKKQYLAVILGGYYGGSSWKDYYDIYDYATGEIISGVEVK